MTQHERVTEELVKLNRLITSGDRKKIMEEKGYSIQYLSNYMNGRGSDLDAATEILVFMRERIAEREERITKLLN